METQTAKFSFLIGFHNRLCAEGLRSMINENELFNVTNLMQNGMNLIQSAKSKELDLLILDLIYPGCDSIEYLREIKKTNKSLKILIISDLTRNGILKDILNTGIEGYILHSCSKNDLYNAVQKLLNNERYICTSLTSQLLCNIEENSKYQTNINLTDREKEILSLLIKMKSNKLIASQLHISELTVKTHRKNIMKKFGSRNLLSLVRYACRENLINGKDDDFCKGCPHRYRLTYN